jgi:hypothetical protein
MITEKEFFNKFDMHVIQSHRKLRRVPNMWHKSNAWNYSISDSAAYQHQTFPIEEVDCVEVLMPEDRLQHIIDYINECEDTINRYKTDRQLMASYERDRVVRLNNPAVEKAYQKYVMLLEIARK